MVATIIGLTLTHILCFILGALVFRNNKAKAEAVIEKAQEVASEVKK